MTDPEPPIKKPKKNFFKKKVENQFFKNVYSNIARYGRDRLLVLENHECFFIFKN